MASTRMPGGRAGWLSGTSRKTVPFTSPSNPSVGQGGALFTHEGAQGRPDTRTPGAVRPVVEILFQQLGRPADPILRTDAGAKVGGPAAHGLIGDHEADALGQFLDAELASRYRLRPDAEGMHASPPERLVGH